MGTTSFLQAIFIGVAMTVAPSALAHHPDSKTPHIFATGWGITLAADGSGFYNDYARFILGNKSAAESYLVSPYRRAMRNFKRDKSSCVYPKSLDTLLRSGDWNKEDRFIESDAMLKSPVRVFTPMGTKPIGSTKALIGKRLAYALGSRIPHSLGDIGVEYVPVADEVDKAKILSTGTVDAMVANLPDAIFVFQSLGMELPPFDKEYDPIPVPRIRLVCHDTERNRQFIRALNERISRLLTSGEIATYLKERDLKPHKFQP